MRKRWATARELIEMFPQKRWNRNAQVHTSLAVAVRQGLIQTRLSPEPVAVVSRLKADGTPGKTQFARITQFYVPDVARYINRPEVIRWSARFVEAR